MVGVTAQARVRAYVRDQMARAVPALTIDALAKRARVAVNTVSAFLNGKSWPQPSKLAAIEAALGLPPGTFERVAAGEPAPDTASPSEAELVSMDRMVIEFSPGVLSDRTPAQAEEMAAAAKLAALRALREMQTGEG